MVMTACWCFFGRREIVIYSEFKREILVSVSLKIEGMPHTEYGRVIEGKRKRQKKHSAHEKREV